MKAAIYTSYGLPDVVRITDVEKPVPKDDEVLIKVRAASVNPIDWRLMKGEPRALRIMPRLLKMPIGRPGVDAAGEVEAVGSNVTQFKPGDEVFGSCRGAFAEYACTAASNLVMKPDDVTFEQGASIFVAGLTALQGLRDKGKIQSGSKVLINGAAGGVGTFAVQIAKTFGAHVTGVCSTRNVEMVRSIGADEVIDYTQSDFTTSNQRYDLILECVGNHSFSECRRVLTAAGRLARNLATDLRGYTRIKRRGQTQNRLEKIASPRSGPQHKAWGGAQRNPRSKVVESIPIPPSGRQPTHHI